MSFITRRSSGSSENPFKLATVVVVVPFKSQQRADAPAATAQNPMIVPDTFGRAMMSVPVFPGTDVNPVHRPPVPPFRVGSQQYVCFPPPPNPLRIYSFPLIATMSASGLVPSHVPGSVFVTVFVVYPAHCVFVAGSMQSTRPFPHTV
jgi:hypothetical protein